MATSPSQSPPQSPPQTPSQSPSQSLSPSSKGTSSSPGPSVPPAPSVKKNLHQQSLHAFRRISLKMVRFHCILPPFIDVVWRTNDMPSMFRNVRRKNCSMHTRTFCVRQMVCSLSFSQLTQSLSNLKKSEQKKSF